MNWCVVMLSALVTALLQALRAPVPPPARLGDPPPTEEPAP
jgi:hypothetical protein